MERTPEQMTREVKQLARDCGFPRVGVASPQPEDRDADRLRAWLEGDYHGEMAWMEDTKTLRLQPEQHLPGCRAIVALSVPYDHPASLSTEVEATPDRGWISRYAWGDDYHDVLRGRLRALEASIRARFGTETTLRSHSDSGPVLERAAAARAGLGWIGKNACLIDGARGSFHFLAVLLTDLPLVPDDPVPERCGSCTRCLDACPTGALFAPGLVDSRRCLSYVTIESHEEPEAGTLHGHVFGCDRCQDVCPWNERARRDGVYGEEAFAPRPGLVHPELAELAALHRGAFRRRFRASPLRRRGLRRFRQTLAALGCANEEGPKEGRAKRGHPLEGAGGEPSRVSGEPNRPAAAFESQGLLSVSNEAQDPEAGVRRPRKKG